MTNMSDKCIKKLVLIDGNAIIHRAYHALPKSMAARSGEQTNAVYGFTTTIIKVLEDLNPDHIACSFDLAGATFRHEHYADYKATRVKADQDLYNQIPRVRQVVETMNIPIYEKESFEADDCLGTMVEQTKKEREAGELEVYIVSGDKDIYQLVNGNVFVYSLRKGLSQMQVVDHKTINEEYNLDPEDFIDLKALAGDPSDNIPGVPGIGPKTATALIQQFDTLEGLYQQIEETRNKIQETNKTQIPNPMGVIASEAKQSSNLAIQQSNNEELENIAKTLNVKPRILSLLVEHRDQAFLSQKLATINRQVPMEFSLEDAKWGGYDKDKLKMLFEELSFTSLLRRFGVMELKNGRGQSEEQKKKDEQLKLL